MIILAFNCGTGPGPARRMLDLGVPALALLMCGLLLIHTGWPSVAAAAGLAGVGLAMGRRRPSRGTDASLWPRVRRTVAEGATYVNGVRVKSRLATADEKAAA